MYRQEIVYDKETDKFACYLDGELVCIQDTYPEAVAVLDQLVLDLMSGEYFKKSA